MQTCVSRQIRTIVLFFAAIHAPGHLVHTDQDRENMKKKEGIAPP